MRDINRLSVSPIVSLKKHWSASLSKSKIAVLEFCFCRLIWVQIEQPSVTYLNPGHCFARKFSHLQILLRHPKLVAFDYWPTKRSELLLSLHWINPLLHWINSLLNWINWKLHYLNQSELRNFSMYIISYETFQFFKAGKSVYIFLTANLFHKKLVLFDILVVWLMKPKARNQNKTSPAKQR